MKRFTLLACALMLLAGCDLFCPEPDRTHNICSIEFYEWDDIIGGYRLFDFDTVSCETIDRPAENVAAECSDDIALFECWVEERRYRDGEHVSKTGYNDC